MGLEGFVGDEVEVEGVRGGRMSDYCVEGEIWGCAVVEGNEMLASIKWKEEIPCLSQVYSY